MASLQIIRVPVPTPTLKPFTSTNCYLIGNDEESILVDAGYDQEETKKLLDQALKQHHIAQPQKIVLTHSHPDHAPGVKQLLDWFPTVYFHENEKEEMLAAIAPCSNTGILNDGETLVVAGESLEIIHAPGHTTGQLNLYHDSTKTLIAGDNIVAGGTTWIGPPDGDMKAYIETLQRLKKLPLSRIAPGHGDWILTPEKHIDFVLQRRLQREQQIKTLLKTHTNLSIKKLTQLIYQDTIHPSVMKAAERTMEAHLIKLMQDGIVLKDTNTNYSLTC